MTEVGEFYKSKLNFLLAFSGAFAPKTPTLLLQQSHYILLNSISLAHGVAAALG